MNISSTTSGATTLGGVNQSDFPTRMEPSMAPVARRFGMTTNQLMTTIKSNGERLADYASSKRVSSPDLTAPIKQGLQDNAPSGVQLSGSQLTNLAQRVENHKPGDGTQDPMPGGAVGGTAATDTTSTIKSETVSGASSTTNTDLNRLIVDPKASDSTTAADATSNTAASVSTNALVDVLTRFDQQL